MSDYWTTKSGVEVRPCGICGIPCPHWKRDSEPEQENAKLISEISKLKATVDQWQKQEHPIQLMQTHYLSERESEIDRLRKALEEYIEVSKRDCEDEWVGEIAKEALNPKGDGK